MRKRIAILALCFAGAAAGQTFIQMTDPQFGFFTGNKGFEQETANFEFAFAAANRLKPAFVVNTGDLVNQAGDAAQIAEYKRIAAKLNPAIKLYNVAGNHDLADPPSKESLEKYRAAFGPDYYTFRVGDIAGFVLNSALEKDASQAPEEAARMEAWFGAELAKARQDGVKHLIVFQHHSLFLDKPDEPDQYFNIPSGVRLRYLGLLHQFGVKYVFAGHYHRNAEPRDADLEMITTGAVGKPLGGSKSGFRIVKVTPDSVTQKYWDFGDLP